MNDQQNFGLITILLHWLIALVTFFLFGLGLWMTSLDYYDVWYNEAPRIHESIGTLLFFFLLFRILWRWFNPPPAPLEGMKTWEVFCSQLVHLTLNLLLIVITVSGYLIVTAKGRPLEVFDWFSLPATLTAIQNQEDLAGEIHLLLAWTVIVLATLHALAALKHHFINRDRILKRMLGRL